MMQIQCPEITTLISHFGIYHIYHFPVIVAVAFVFFSQAPNIWCPDTYYHGGEHREDIGER